MGENAMRRIAIVGAGQAGAQLALGLLSNGYQVTLVSDRTPQEIRNGPVMSSQCMFETALQTERSLGLNLWDQDCPAVDAISFSVTDPTDPADSAFSWAGPL